MYELVPYRGLGSLGRLRRDFDGLLSRFFEGGELPYTGGGGGFVPSVDVRETDTGLEVIAEVPGLKPEEIEVTLTGDILSIRGEKKDETEETKGDYHLIERRHGSFVRSFRLPFGVDRGRLEAKHKDGVLHVTLPRAAEAGAEKIAVKGG